MMIYDCDTVRDMLPLLVRGDVLPHERTAANQHLAGCADCTREAGIVSLLQQSFEPVPAGLEDRVLAAVTNARTRGGRHSLPDRGFAPARLAMAATVTLALIGGALAINLFTDPRSDGDQMMLAEFELPTAMIGWVDSDPLLHAGTTLDELTVEELEELLAELES